MQDGLHLREIGNAFRDAARVDELDDAGTDDAGEDQSRSFGDDFGKRGPRAGDRHAKQSSILIELHVDGHSDLRGERAPLYINL